MDNATNIGLLVVGITALVVLANGLTTFFNNWYTNKNKPNDIHQREYKEFKSETLDVLKSLDTIINKLDITVTKLDLTLDNVTKDQLAMKKDIDVLQEDVSTIKKTIYSKHYIK